MSRIELPPEMAVGFRFYPTDVELIRDYLKPKLLGKVSKVDHVIAEVDFFKFEPSDLPPMSKIGSNDGMWLFFCVQNLKFGGSKKSRRKTKSSGIWKITGKRTTGTGFWKITGEERKVKDQDTKECIGRKRTLVFHKGSHPGQKTNWVMQLYYIIPDHPSPKQRTYALCRLKKKADDIAKSPGPEEGANAMANPPDTEEGQPEQGEPSRGIMSEDEDPVTTAPIPRANAEEEAIQELRSQPLYSPGSDFADEETSLLPSVGYCHGLHELQAFSRAAAPEESPEDIVNRLIADQDAEYYRETANIAFESAVPQALLRDYRVGGYRDTGRSNRQGGLEASGPSPVGSDDNITVARGQGPLPVGSNYIRRVIERQANFSAAEDTALSPHDQFSEEESSALNLTLRSPPTMLARGGSTERPQNEVEEEAEILNSVPVPSPGSCFFLLLVIAILFAVAFAAVFGVLVYSTYKRLLEFSRKRRSFLLFCFVLSICCNHLLGV